MLVFTVIWFPVNVQDRFVVTLATVKLFEVGIIMNDFDISGPH
jgi:hypothetical protein